MIPSNHRIPINLRFIFQEDIENMNHPNLTKSKTRISLIRRALLIITIAGLILPQNGCRAHSSARVYIETTTDTVPPTAITSTTETQETIPAAETAWNLILVNPWNPLPDDFSVTLTELINGHYIDQRAYPDLQDMMDDARAAGLDPLICSSYRTTEDQKALYDNRVSRFLAEGYTQEEAQTKAAKWVAVPGTSEHQTGLAIDIVATSYQLLDESQKQTAEQQWLMENSYKYGFILRYPSDKSDITGIYYEPWHYRYVGKEAALEIYEQGICLEEYLANNLH